MNAMDASLNARFAMQARVSCHVMVLLIETDDECGGERALQGSFARKTSSTTSEQSSLAGMPRPGPPWFKS